MRIKNRLLILVFTATFLSVQSQRISERGSGPIVLEKHQLRFDLLSPGISYEIGLFRNQTVSTSLGLATATYEEGYAFGLAMNNRYRYYHNFKRREELGKRISGNSGNYIAAAQAIFFSQLRLATDIEPDDYNLGFYGVVYGIQRTYDNGFNINVELGGGYYRGDGAPSGYGPLFGVNFGWVATKRKSRKPSFD
ncbi:MAG: hypothetical protein KJO86_06680 [Muriicola sp.]|nr:hypothetical protein [Muriicola sp.]